jgi:alpha-L-fucosidase 2
VGIRHDGLTAPLRQPASAALTLHAVTELDTVIGTATTFAGLGLPPEGDAHTASARATAAVRRAFTQGTDEVRRRQTADHRALYRRVRWEPASEKTGADVERRPLDERLVQANAAGGHPLTHDPDLAPLLFHYGRYLLISSSRGSGTRSCARRGAPTTPPISTSR